MLIEMTTGSAMRTSASLTREINTLNHNNTIDQFYE